MLGDRALGAGDTLDTAGLLTRSLPAADVLAAHPGGMTEAVLAALAAAVRRWRRHGGDALLVDLEGHGRAEDFVAEPVDLSRTVGWFTAQHPVRLDLTAPGVRPVRDALAAAPHQGLSYGLLRHVNPATAAVLADAPRPQVEVNYLGRMDGDGDDLLGGSTGGDAPLTHAIALNVAVVGARLVAHWTYAGASSPRPRSPNWPTCGPTRSPPSPRPS
ncbi:condensation domain-containing protein [Actinokineospora soli]|uniref:Condensation domain-containing protein n=1 Tax=Actinokineospora soli TaxID=1048753 RepID=A0ABW2TPA3_9PSEU